MNPKVLIRLVLRLVLIGEESVVFFGKYMQICESASVTRSCPELRSEHSSGK